MKLPQSISQNTTVSEENSDLGLQNTLQPQANDENFADQNQPAKSPIQMLIKKITKETNRHKLNYQQLKYIFRAVRNNCQIQIPNRSARKLRELPTRDEIKAFYAVIANPLHKLIFETLEGTGLRVSELCGLMVHRIDFTSNLVFISEGKGKKDRVAIIGNLLLEKIKIYLSNRRNKFLYETNRNTKFSPRRIEQLCSDYKSLAGITKDLTPHTFRHIWNTRLAEAGVSEERRAILAGHENIETQKIYTHLSGAAIKDEILPILDGIHKK